jgi:RNA polymerase sigma factor (TIGR02999 family)
MGRLLPLIYDELRKIAAAYMARENSGHTLQATALVNEAWFRLVDQEQVHWQSRSHFYGVAAQIMRRILRDHARAKHAEKRGGHQVRIPIDEIFNLGQEGDSGVIELDDAINRLAEINERQAKVVEMRFFAGLAIEEIATALETSPATVKRDWTFAKAWLFKELTGGGG